MRHQPRQTVGQTQAPPQQQPPQQQQQPPQQQRGTNLSGPSAAQGVHRQYQHKAFDLLQRQKQEVRALKGSYRQQLLLLDQQRRMVGWLVGVLLVS